MAATTYWHLNPSMSGSQLRHYLPSKLACFWRLFNNGAFIFALVVIPAPLLFDVLDSVAFAISVVKSRETDIENKLVGMSEGLNILSLLARS